MQMNAHDRVNEYKASLEELFAKIRRWVLNHNMTVKETEIEVSEPRAGVYAAPKLTIYDKNNVALAEVVPVGAWIIGADWRVDVRGHLEKEALVYWKAGAPLIRELSVGGPDGHAVEKPLFRGAEEPGWYWVENGLRAKARPVDEELFMDLVAEVQPL